MKVHNPGFLQVVADAKARVREIGVEEYRRQAGSLVLLDVREDHEWNEAHAQGAIHLSKGVIERDIETAVPDPETKLALYCGGGYRSALAADSLQKMGYANVFSLAGGWRAWVEAGLPVESGQTIKT